MSDISNEPDDTMSFIPPSSPKKSSTPPTPSLSFKPTSPSTPPANSPHPPTSPQSSPAAIPSTNTRTIGLSPLSFNTSLLITIVDGLPSSEPLYTQAWAGTSVLAEALSHTRNTRTPPRPRALHLPPPHLRHLRPRLLRSRDPRKTSLRFHTSFPSTVSTPTVSQPDSSLVSQTYMAQNFQLGPLGSHYPDIAYTMEGDSPAILHTMMNGLNGGPYDHPEWGGWGGGYILLDRSGQSNVYSNTYDVVLGKDNRTLTSNHATTWRWRQAFQDEMSARVQWSILPSYASGSHPPVVVINGSCGSQPIIYTLPGGSTITLDVRKTYDPDETLPGKNELQYNWFQYREVTDVYINNIAFLPQLNFTTSESGRVVQTKLPEREVACSVPTGGRATYGVGEVCQNICYFGGGGEWEAAGEEV
ncbi:unnamed protein product [Zymoseptoria tritici ST99CH_1A5]|uniref:Uncharacterized protein n=1 Tax=Zymoseptoria tritici ST99CH_1A5 TaxID=1276529 RepID=A0A1Y6LSA2_ZYMTR|nr:unnamed protein product [Zymoseptoria tritici ST99CH_1A5]